MEEENISYTDEGIVSSDVLNEYETSMQRTTNLNYADEIKFVINDVFKDFGIDVIVTGHIVGPNIIRFSLHTGKNVSVKSITNLISDLQVRLGGVPVRLDDTSSGMHDIGLEVEAKMPETVSFKSLYEALPKVAKYPLAIPLGVKVTDERVWIDLENAPHILISGTTGSGKSIFIRSAITSLIMRNSPNDVKLALFDPKMVELSNFNDIPHLLCPIVKDAKTAYNVLNILEEEMFSRYAKMSEASCCCLDEYNEYATENKLNKLPRIVVVIDEYGDLVDSDKRISEVIISLAQKARAAGIHLILGVQNPTTNVVTGVLKANVPVHIAFMASSVLDSMVVLGQSGAEKLAGRGDMFVQSPFVSRIGLVRLQGCFIHRTEIKRVVDDLKDLYKTQYDEKYLEQKAPANNSSESIDSEDDHYQMIKDWAIDREYVSISSIQRECAVGFNRASRYFAKLQEEGILAKESDKKGCKVIKRK